MLSHYQTLEKNTAITYSHKSTQLVTFPGKMARNSRKLEKERKERKKKTGKKKKKKKKTGKDFVMVEKNCDATFRF